MIDLDLNEIQFVSKYVSKKKQTGIRLNEIILDLTANFCVSGVEFCWDNAQRLRANLRHFG